MQNNRPTDRPINKPIRQLLFWLSIATRIGLSNIALLPITYAQTLNHAHDSATTWHIDQFIQPFDYQRGSQSIRYARVTQPSKRWHLCIAYPHLKDAYWINVNYGMVQEALALGVTFELVEAGGYLNLERQTAQILECTQRRSDALVLGSVSFAGNRSAIASIAQVKPVLATVNDIEDANIIAKVGVSWTEMGRLTGEYISKRHPRNSKTVKIAWFPGPKEAGWVNFIHDGFLAGLADSSAHIVVTKWGDTGKEIQRTLLQQALEEQPNPDYIIGNALVAEAAISELRRRQLETRINIVSTYLTPAVYRGIRREKILAAPTDSPVLQGRLSINQAVQVLEKRPFIKHMGPKIQLIDKTNINSSIIAQSLSPASFVPTFTVP